jgi:hypothetical protein
LPTCWHSPSSLCYRPRPSTNPAALVVGMHGFQLRMPGYGIDESLALFETGNGNDKVLETRAKRSGSMLEGPLGWENAWAMITAVFEQAPFRNLEGEYFYPLITRTA